MTALERGGWSFEPTEAGQADPAALVAELDAIAAQLAELGVDQGVLTAHLGILVELLNDAPRQLWAEPLTLFLEFP